MIAEDALRKEFGRFAKLRNPHLQANSYRQHRWNAPISIGALEKWVVIATSEPVVELVGLPESDEGQPPVNKAKSVEIKVQVETSVISLPDKGKDPMESTDLPFEKFIQEWPICTDDLRFKEILGLFACCIFVERHCIC
ncbi:hypothetical protein ACH5RR_008034 [Cinchona calisaya]|uniref:Transposase n=1 Tax=Cinchona calisaya TaxID=153742 RepID=A0ABD3AD56_9GENT